MHLAKKNQQPDLIDNRAPFYITTNDVPYFGEDDENECRRIRVFNTKSIKDDKLIKNVDQWCDVHAMDCIVWTANELNDNIDRTKGGMRMHHQSKTSLRRADTIKGETSG